MFDENTCHGYVYDKDVVEALDKRWFGRREAGNKLVLSLEEIAYLMLRREFTVSTKGSKLKSLSDLMERHHRCFERMFWPRLVIYDDLRRRGRKVKILDDKRFLVKHKDGSLKLVLVLEEKNLISINEILEQVEQARRNNLELALAIVSLQGDTTYYTVSTVELRKG